MTAVSDAVPLAAGTTEPLERFGRLDIERAPDVLAPRSWTVAQSRWAARLADEVDDGPALELYAGGGQIGLEFVRLTGRPLVQVEASLAACKLARRNADRNGLGELVTVRHTRVGTPLRRTFALVLADPPYVPRREIHAFPDDPTMAIDGGPDGVDHLRELVRALPRYVGPTSPVLVQVRGPDQADRLRDLVLDARAPLRVDEVRVHAPDRAVALLRPR